jgi:oxygen-independent coproporphyrinogen-3 oxidase
LAGLWALFNKLASPPFEFTIEANPESATEAFLNACREGGATRISLGVQSFHEPSRLAVRRPGSLKQLDESLSLAAKYFPNAFSADLITDLPFHTNKIIANDIKQLLAYNPAHVSLYSLALDPQTPLGKKASSSSQAAGSQAAGPEQMLLPGDEADALWISGRDLLESSGFWQYEISNFARPHKTCAHNIRYWQMDNWLGAGPASSGTIVNDETGRGKRHTYPSDVQTYLAMPPPRIKAAFCEELSRSDLAKETLLMGFRYCEGPDAQRYKTRFGRSIEDSIPETIARWKERGFFAAGLNTLAPSRSGLLFLNGFLRDAFDELDK